MIFVLTAIIVSKKDLQSSTFIKADTFRDMRRADPRCYGSETLLNALDLAVVEPKGIPSQFELPTFHSKRSRRKRLSIIGESLSKAKLANLPERVEALSKKTQELMEAKRKTIEDRANRKRKRIEKELQKERAKRQEIEREENYHEIAEVLKAKRYTRMSRL